MANAHFASTHTPEEIAKALGKHQPTPEQAGVISAGPGPLLVTAGAGAGKTETMASRVVYLVANGMVKPDEVLGLTFTRKAAGQLEQRIRRSLIDLRGSGLIEPRGEIGESLTTIAPKAMTYDSFVGELVREFGLLAPVEPFARLITAAEEYAIAHDLVSNYTGKVGVDKQVASVTEDILALAGNMSNRLYDVDTVRDLSTEFLRAAEELPPATKKTEYSKKLLAKMDAQRGRINYLPLVAELARTYRDKQVTTFGEQMAVAARLVVEHPGIGKQLRSRYKVVMLDEYQDTSHAQRVFLRTLFGHAEGAAEGEEPTTVTAVGDPMQSIYGWRGASEENLSSFATDFPAADGFPAPKKELTTSWRNPRLVLDMANTVADVVLADGNASRLVGPLQPRSDAEVGDVQLGYFATSEDECRFVAEHMRDKYVASREAGKELSAAILVRQNSHSVEIAHYLDELDVPYEIVGLGGLLSEPEIQDLLAVATMLIRPQDNSAALRVLSGPMCGIGMRDITALRERARNLAGRLVSDDLRGEEPASHTAQEETDPDSALSGADDGTILGWLRREVAERTPEAPEQAVGLTDAVADLGERDRYTPDGLQRLEELSSTLRALRSYSLSKPLLDLFADIERAFNVRTEALARGGAAGTAHLDQFADVVATFPGSGLAAWLDYCAMAREREDGLQPGEVPAADDRVLIMTTHKAKGLEWEHVSVLHVDSQTYSGKANSYVTRSTELPSAEDYLDAAAFAGDKEPTRTHFDKAGEAKKQESKHANELEAARLFYVALTRTESTLTVTGGGTNHAKAKKGPYEFLQQLAAKFPDHVVCWNDPNEPQESGGRDEKDGDSTHRERGAFPYLAPDRAALEAADTVRAALDNLPDQVAGERFQQWETEASALIEEHRGLMAPEVEVAVPTELTASDVVALRGDPTQFARRQRRPVPFKPNAYAKRGTAFHSWLEEYFGGSALLSEEELPGLDEELGLEDLAALKESFQASQWAQRTPVEVEAPFEITVDGVVVRGRMDAVFRDPDGAWVVVDWKTGRPPQGEDMRAAEQQLAVYREAWRRIRQRAGEEAPQVKALFHYVTDGFDFEPRHLGGADELAGVLRQAVRRVEY